MGLENSKECKEALIKWILKGSKPFTGEQRTMVASIPEKWWGTGLGMRGVGFKERAFRDEAEST